MRALICILLALVCLSCSHEDSVSSPVKEKVTITWNAYSQGKEIKGSIRVDVYTHDGKQYGADSIHNNVYLQLDKGDYVTFMITTYPEDQSQNEAGINVTYLVTSGTQKVILEGNTNGAGFLIK